MSGELLTRNERSVTFTGVPHHKTQLEKVILRANTAWSHYFSNNSCHAAARLGNLLSTWIDLVAWEQVLSDERNGTLLERGSL